MRILTPALICVCFFCHAQQIETVIQRGHELAVLSVAQSPDSTLLATGSRDKSVKIWDYATGREIRSLLGHEYSVTTLAFSPDGKILLTGSSDGTLRAWDILSGQELSRKAFGEETLTDVIWSPDGTHYAVSTLKGNVRIFTKDGSKPEREIEVNAESNRRGVNLDFSPDGALLAIGQDNRMADVYRVANGTRVHRFEFGEGWCGGCATYVDISPDGKFMFMASNNGSAKQYDLASGKLIRQFAADIDDPTSLRASPDGKLLMLATEKEVTVWQLTDGARRTHFAFPDEKEINEVIFSSNSQDLLITSNKNTCLQWNLRRQQSTKEFTGFLNQRDQGGITYDPNFIWDMQIAKYVRFKNQLQITPDGKTLIKGKFGTRVKRWDMASGKTVTEYKGHAKAVLCHDLSRDGKRLVTGGGDGKIILWDTETGDSLKVIRAHREPILDIQFNSDESMVAASSWDARMISWDLSTGKSVHYFDFENNSALNLLWGPSDLYLIASQGKDIKMYETDTRQAVREFVGHQEVVGSLRLSADQQQLLSASWDGTVRLWNIGTGLASKKFVGHEGAVHIAVFSPDGRLVYSAGADRAIRVWDILTGKLVRTLEGHKAEVTSLLFSPNGQMLVSHSVDGATKFWELPSGKEFFEHIHFGENEWMVKNPDGYFNGTQAARQYIHFVDGMKSYSVDQFFEDFFRPDLLPRIFQNRGGEEKSDLKGKLMKSPPPQVKVAVLPSTTAGQADVFVKMTDGGGGVSGLRLLHNGKAVTLSTRQLQFPDGANQSATYRHTLTLVGGNNTFSAVATNRDRIDSDISTVDIYSEQSGKTSTCYVLAIGINQYKNPKMALQYARPDASSFATAMKEKGKLLFKEVVVEALYDGEATREQILAKLDGIAARIGPEDVFIFYYAGHGSMVEDHFFFVPTECSRLYDLSSLQKDALEAGQMQEKFRNIPALKQLIVMDACQSGGSVELLAHRGAAEEKAIAQLSRSAGIHVMASAGSDQYATEFTSLQHGLFTYLFLQALEGAADGAPKDGKVTIYELKGYLDDQVPEMTRKLKGKPQFPYTFSRGQDFPVVIEN